MVKEISEDLQDYGNEAIIPILTELQIGGIGAATSYCNKKEFRIKSWHDYFGSAPLSEEARRADALTQNFIDSEKTPDVLKRYLNEWYSLARREMPPWLKLRLEV